MKNKFSIIFALFIALLLSCKLQSEENISSKSSNILSGYTKTAATIKDITPAPTYYREQVSASTFANYLRNLKLKTLDQPVYLFNGKLKDTQSAHFAVIDMDIGKRDLQQCADAVMRLRAEYLYKREKHTRIHFNYTSGHKVEWSRWAKGYRPIVNGNKVYFKKKSGKDYSYKNFRNYLNNIFTYAGTHSLAKELMPVKNISDIQIGDVFIQGGFPGHAVIVVDIAQKQEDIKSKTKSNKTKKIFLLAQSFMPAQNIHILKNPMNAKLSPWYSTDFDHDLVTPEWTFKKKNLKRFH